MHHLGFVLLGVILAPAVGWLAKDTMRTGIKSGLVVGNRIQEFASDLKDEVCEISQEIEDQQR